MLAYALIGIAAFFCFMLGSAAGRWTKELNVYAIVLGASVCFI